MATEPDETDLPPFLRECPTEIDQMPLQVMLLTHEVAALRLILMRLAKRLGETATAIEPYRVPFLGGADANGNGHD